MNSSNLCSFELNVLEFFNKNNIIRDNLKIGTAVSGGADSLALLVSLCNVFTPLNIKIHVITVNHFIRKDEETCGDVEHVINVCQELKKQGFNLEFYVCNLKKGQVAETAQKRKCGIEEAARFLRYEAFENFIQENKLEYLCLAHNKNDNLETLLMRFLSGSSCEGLRGIEQIRKPYLRPLLNTSRTEIEEYLNSKNISWRTDSTNLDDAYLRNNIRLNLVPFLNEHFADWEKGVEKSCEYLSLDFETVQKRENDFLDKNWDKKKNAVPFSEFITLESGMQKKILLKLCNSVSEKARISSSFLEDFCAELKKTGKIYAKKEYEDLELIYENGLILAGKTAKKQTDLCFFGIIEKEGDFEFPFGNLEVLKANNCYNFRFYNLDEQKNVQVFVKNLPVCVRNIQLDDEIKCKDGSYKKIADILSNWHVSSEHKQLIPIIQMLDTKNQEIVCIAAELFGYKNWIVK